eukprot:s2367_g8.t1
MLGLGSPDLEWGWEARGWSKGWEAHDSLGLGSPWPGKAKGLKLMIWGWEAHGLGRSPRKVLIRLLLGHQGSTLRELPEEPMEYTVPVDDGNGSDPSPEPPVSGVSGSTDVSAKSNSLTIVVGPELKKRRISISLAPEWVN